MKIPPSQNIEQTQEATKNLLAQVINLAKMSTNSNYFNSATRATEYDSPGLVFDKSNTSAFQQVKNPSTTSQFFQVSQTSKQQPAPAWDILAKMCESDSDSPRDAIEPFSPQMQARQRGFKRGNYARIPDETRARLIKMVVEDGIGVVKATARLGIKYTTGKHIVRRYMRTGQFADKRFKHVDARFIAKQPQMTQTAQKEPHSRPLVVSLPTENDLPNQLKFAANRSQPSVKTVAEWMAKNQTIAPAVSKPTIELIHQQINPVLPPPKIQFQPQDRLTSSVPQLVGGQQLKIHTININGKPMRFVQLDQ